MLETLEAFYRRQIFCPGPAGIFLNPRYILRRALFRAMRRYAPRLDGALLDFGCGSKPYKHLFVNTSLYLGLDIKEGDTRAGEENIDVLFDGKIIPLRNGSFDSALATEVFEHVLHIEHTLQELNRVLKPGGLLLGTTPFVWREHGGPDDYARYTSSGLRHLLEEAGFAVISFDKSANCVETLFQLLIVYLVTLLPMRKRYISTLLQILFLSPLTMLGIFLGRLLPFRDDLYLTNIVLARKKG